MLGAEAVPPAVSVDTIQGLVVMEAAGALERALLGAPGRFACRLDLDQPHTLAAVRAHDALDRSGIGFRWVKDGHPPLHLFGEGVQPFAEAVALGQHQPTMLLIEKLLPPLFVG